MIPTKNPFVQYRSIGGKTYLSIKGRVFELDQISVKAWSLIDGINSLSDIVNSIAEEYDEKRKTVNSDIVTFLTDLKEKNLITYSN
jgi:hypothetical protein